MNIIETEIPDVTIETLDQSKIILANNIVKNVYPLFDEVFNTRLNELDDFQQILKDKKRQVREEKNNLQHMVNIYNKNKKVTKLLDRIEKLVNSGLVYDGSSRNEMTMLLKVINKLSDDKIDYHLKSVMSTISKRFSER
jgi:hypothetical protein